MPNISKNGVIKGRAFTCSRPLDGPIATYIDGRPKICKLCPNFVRVSPRRLLLCPKHLQAWDRERNKRVRERRFLRRAQDILTHKTDTSKPPPFSDFAGHSKEHDYAGPFSHLPPAVRQLAFQELNLIIERRPNITGGAAYARAIATATIMALHGGRRRWRFAMLHAKSLRSYYRNKTAALGITLLTPHL